MASLKHNGPEKARVVFRKRDEEGVERTHHYSLGERGWVLRRVDVVFADGHRAKGGWKRYMRWAEVPKTVQVLRNRYERDAWEEVPQ